MAELHRNRYGMSLSPFPYHLSVLAPFVLRIYGLCFRFCIRFHGRRPPSDLLYRNEHCPFILCIILFQRLILSSLRFIATRSSSLHCIFTIHHSHLFFVQHAHASRLSHLFH